MDLNELQKHWDQFGRDDPMWAVITDPAKRYGGWDPQEFLASGIVEVERNLRHLADRGFDPPKDRALDFGCGPGRATQALCRHFAQVDGVDIAPSMVELARTWNQFGESCHYVVNEGPDLRQFGDNTFDLIYTFHVLQHMMPSLQRDYLREMVRCLSADGIALVELITGPVQGAGRALPSAAFRAHVSFDAPDTLSAGSELTITVRVRNSSAVPWPARGTDGWYGVTVGNRWRDGDGAVLMADDARTLFSADVMPGDEVDLALNVHTPDRPGQVVLEVDLIQEGVAWFQDRGSPPARKEILLQSAVSQPGPAGELSPAAESPRMEMHVLPLAVCRSTIAAAGGKVVDVTPFTSIHGGHDYDFQRCCIVFRRRPTGPRSSRTRWNESAEQSKDYLDIFGQAMLTQLAKARRRASRTGSDARSLLRRIQRTHKQ